MLFIGDPAGIRTPDTLLKRQVLCRLSYWIKKNMGWVKGLEPSTLGTTIRCSNQLSYTHHIKFAADGNGTPGGIRTPGLLLRRQLLYPAELLAHINSDKPIRRKWSG